MVIFIREIFLINMIQFCCLSLKLIIVLKIYFGQLSSKVKFKRVGVTLSSLFFFNNLICNNVLYVLENEANFSQQLYLRVCILYTLKVVISNYNMIYCNRKFSTLLINWLNQILQGFKFLLFWYSLSLF